MCAKLHAKSINKAVSLSNLQYSSKTRSVHYSHYYYSYKCKVYNGGIDMMQQVYTYLDFVRKYADQMKKDKQWLTVTYTENKRSSNKNPVKTGNELGYPEMVCGSIYTVMRNSELYSQLTLNVDTLSKKVCITYQIVHPVTHKNEFRIPN